MKSEYFGKNMMLNEIFQDLNFGMKIDKDAQLPYYIVGVVVS